LIISKITKFQTLTGCFFNADGFSFVERSQVEKVLLTCQRLTKEDLAALKKWDGVPWITSFYQRNA
jgi:hypothetical protein